MGIDLDYDWLAPKLSSSERAALDNIYNEAEKSTNRIKKLESLLYEVARRAEKMGIDDNGLDFTVTIDSEMWEKIKDAV